ncbi:hypothetical protein [Sinobacterium caligoides]|uniref:hypothetical protein n=1 Tax=Sinobacterium caligoides TaxID=933926 RepID=UPI0011CDDB1C|nr:hypothetical protein [Sinobacterium caligoides]
MVLLNVITNQCMEAFSGGVVSPYKILWSLLMKGNKLFFRLRCTPVEGADSHSSVVDRANFTTLAAMILEKCRYYFLILEGWFIYEDVVVGGVHRTNVGEPSARKVAEPYRMSEEEIDAVICYLCLSSL